MLSKWKRNLHLLYLWCQSLTALTVWNPSENHVRLQWPLPYLENFVAIFSNIWAVSGKIHKLLANILVLSNSCALFFLLLSIARLPFFYLILFFSWYNFFQSFSWLLSHFLDCVANIKFKIINSLSERIVKFSHCVLSMFYIVSLLLGAIWVKNIFDHISMMQISDN